MKTHFEGTSSLIGTIKGQLEYKETVVREADENVKDSDSDYTDGESEHSEVVDSSHTSHKVITEEGVVQPSSIEILSKGSFTQQRE